MMKSRESDSPHVAYDESGHSGSNLLRENEPFLTLGSVRVTSAQIAEVEDLFGPMQAKEWKFKNFKSRPRYLAKFAELLQLSWVNDDSIQVFAVHKRFMVVTKLVDLLQEPSARACGHNLYEFGGNLSLSNLLYEILPTYLGRQRYDKFLADFVAVVRSQTDKDFQEFKSTCWECNEYLESTVGDGVPGFVAFLWACEHPDTWLPLLGPLEMDPLVPAYHAVSNTWGQRLQCMFEIVADESKTLAQESDMLMRFADPTLRNEKIPCPGGVVEFPLKVSDIRMVRSETSRAVQLADLVAGATNSLLNSLCSGESLAPWQAGLGNFFDNHNVFRGMLPTRGFTPEQVDAEHVSGLGTVEYASRVLSGDPSVRQ